MQVVDRRLDPKAKSLGNRQRFMRRAKAEIRTAVREALKKRKVSEVEGSQNISISSKSLRDPRFGLRVAPVRAISSFPAIRTSASAIPSRSHPGWRRQRQGRRRWLGRRRFVFTLTRDEFLDLFFEDLKLPNMVKAQLKSVKAHQYARAGITSDGPPAKLNRGRTMRNSLARRIALNRPTRGAQERLEEELARAEAEVPRNEARIAVSTTG